MAATVIEALAQAERLLQAGELDRAGRLQTNLPRRRGWSLRRYMALFMAVLLVVAAIAALAVRTMAEQDARQPQQRPAAEGHRAVLNLAILSAIFVFLR